MNDNTNLENKYISVTQLNNFIKVLFDNTSILHNIIIHGEISNFTGKNRSGHLYFSLKDEQCSIKAVMFKCDAVSLKFPIKDGDEVLAYGSISSYPPNGTYQVIIKKIDLFGQGAMLLKKQQLKEKLFKEGYFNEDHKKELPKYPLKIGIISGKNSAAVVDIITNINRRFPLVNITVYYSLVQGNEAPMDLIKSLNKAINDNLDVIIIGRGGGSLEDLEAFDDEKLIKEIYKCDIPVISAVGHEINKSLCDLVSDKYASTPTGAAELVVPDRKDLLEELNQTKHYINTLIISKINDYMANLTNISKNKSLTNISNIFDLKIEKLEFKKTFLNNFISKIFTSLDNDLLTKEKLINAFNPENLLKKGYSIVYDSNNKIVNSKNNVSIEDILKIKMTDGEIKTVVKEK